MTVDKRVLVGIFVLGSCWGLVEAVMGSALKSVNLPYGVIMTAVFALPILLMSKLFFRQRGVQSGIGVVAGSLAFFNPWVGCSVCSAIAIAAEGVLFEVIWFKIEKEDFGSLNLLEKASLGVVSAYGIYVSGYIITQILTPALYGNFVLTNLLVALPQILAQGLPAALLGIITIPATILALDNLKLTIRDRIYYPTGMTITVICWLFVVGNWFIFIS